KMFHVKHFCPIGSFFAAIKGPISERDEQKCEAVLRSHPALNHENRSRFMILDRFDPKSS
ncbi:MAG TPA: hypothetical protein VME69_12150, partial [Methylocella sp.]|nr:hypothetical protein [Methylocella sp.]